jgi:diaminopimelate epimerase
MLEINFSKLTGAGNDFVLIDKMLNPELEVTPSLIRKLCDRRFGIGADGLLTISNFVDVDVDFEMEYFNADGSTGMLCGNGARCIIKYADLSGRIKNSKTKFKFQSDFFSGEILDQNEIKFNLNSPSEMKLKIKIDVLGSTFNA